MSAFAKKLTESEPFNRFIIFVIVTGAVLVGLETSASLMKSFGGILSALSTAVVTIFVLEALLKVGARLPRPFDYFRDPWNVFDFLIVVGCLFPAGDTHWVAVFRLVRVLRVLRLITAIPRLQILVTALIKSFPSMGYVGLLLVIHFYMFGVLGVFLFKETDPLKFGTLGRSVLTLFEVITLEGWVDVMNVQLIGDEAALAAAAAAGTLPVGPHPLAAPVFFVLFIVLGTMIILNLFIGVIVGAMSEAQAESLELKRRDEGADVSHGTQVELLEQQLEDMKKNLERLKVTYKRDVTRAPFAPRGD